MWNQPSDCDQMNFILLLRWKTQDNAKNDETKANRVKSYLPNPLWFTHASFGSILWKFFVWRYHYNSVLFTDAWFLQNITAFLTWYGLLENTSQNYVVFYAYQNLFLFRFFNSIGWRICCFVPNIYLKVIRLDLDYSHTYSKYKLLQYHCVELLAQHIHNFIIRFPSSLR